jgi:hypothetical protein
VTWKTGAVPQLALSVDEAGCHLDQAEMPASWLQKFPTGEEIIRKTLELRPPNGSDIDSRLIRRRECEYQIFRSVEEVRWLSRIREGFTSIDDFVNLAQSVLQSRKSRSGNSLELHLREIMMEESLRPDEDFSHRPIIEGTKRPDFLFPSRSAYEDAAFPTPKLRMLAVKTTCKDRWRQVLNEADRVALKHLLTLQEGVSEHQFREMQEASVQLVVPARLHKSYPKSVRPHLLSLESFIAEIRLLRLGVN